jgi:hypothetical protein
MAASKEELARTRREFGEKSDEFSAVLDELQEVMGNQAQSGAHAVRAAAVDAAERTVAIFRARARADTKRRIFDRLRLESRDFSDAERAHRVLRPPQWTPRAVFRLWKGHVSICKQILLSAVDSELDMGAVRLAVRTPPGERVAWGEGGDAVEVAMAEWGGIRYAPTVLDLGFRVNGVELGTLRRFRV